MTYRRWFLVLAVVSMALASAQAFAEGSLSYQCKVDRWNYHKGVGRICGEFRLLKDSTDSDREVVLEDCKVKVYGGSAFSGFMGKSVMTVNFGTRVSKLVSAVADTNLRDMVATSLDPASAPEKFELSLFPGSLRYRGYSYSLTCTKD